MDFHLILELSILQHLPMAIRGSFTNIINFSLLKTNTNKLPKTLSLINPKPVIHRRRRLGTNTIVAYKVTIEHQGEERTLEVEPDETILSRALDEGLNVPHDCKLGVCMTCPAKLLSGKVDQSEGMLSDDVVAQGYALLCAAYPRSDCSIRTIPEEELLSLQLATSDD